MKFPRNARIYQGHLDATPYVAVFFVLVLLLMLSSLVYTPGFSLHLPTARGLPGNDQPTVSVAIDAGGRLYFENQWVTNEDLLTARLRQENNASGQPLTLLVQADKGTSYEMLVRVTMLASQVGITNFWLATLPRPTASWTPQSP
jgi:biopolymer transport protein ExbD